jgi:LysR family hydrogen peroxide-inducible transcriptional activator
MNINLRDLRYLVALADYKHFGKAADACFVSQPTLSAQLKKLEEALGVQLIERTQRQVRLTAIGENMVARARRVLRETDDIVAAARQYQDPLTGRLHMGFIPTLGPYLLPYIVPVIREHWPQLQLFLFEDQTQRLLTQLREGHLDVVVLALPVETQGLEIIELFTEAFVVALPKQHPLTRKARLRTADLDGETVLLLEDGHCLRDQALEICDTAHAPERRDFRATSLETLRHMVGAGAGITLLPQLAVSGPVPDYPAVVVRPFVEPAPCRTIGIVFRKATARRKAIQVVGEAIKETMAGVFKVMVAEAAPDPSPAASAT